MNTYSVSYVTADNKRRYASLDAKNLTMLEQIIHRIQYTKQDMIITSIVLTGMK